MILREGTATDDPRLDRCVQFDERSRGFPIRAALAGRVRRSYTWRCTTWLDQGREGACVGAALTHELAARPSEVRGLTMRHAVETYHEAQRLDPWIGGSYPGAVPFYEGTSVLAGVQALHARGWFETYRWAFGLEDVLLGLGHNGPAVLGLNWYEGMMATDPAGFIAPTGRLLGGHAILARGTNVPGDFTTLRNSWGPDWGIDGDCRIRNSDLARLLHEQGEAVFLMGRRTEAAG
jgi:hypothetical protein